MSTTYTIDASVFLNAFNPYELGHENSYRLLALLHARAIPIIVPTLLLPEVSAAIARGRQNVELAHRFTRALGQLPHVVWVPLDNTLARQSADVAAQHGLRGSDAIYLATALRFGSKLITLDREQGERAAAVVPSCGPAEAFAALSSV